MLEDEIVKLVRETVASELAKIPRIYQDSVEMGSPTKGGAVKVYFNSSDVSEAKMKVDNAVLVKDHLADKLNATRQMP